MADAPPCDNALCRNTLPLVVYVDRDVVAVGKREYTVVWRYCSPECREIVRQDRAMVATV